MDPMKRQAAREGERLRRDFVAAHSNDGENTIPRFLIKSISRDRYRPAGFVKKTATPELYRELEDHLQQLWTINEEHVGEDNVTVNVYLELTESHRPLVRSMVGWCRRYFEHRAAKFNAKDKSDSVQKYLRLLREYFDAVGLREDSVDYLLIDMPLRFAYWYLYEQTWKNEVHVRWAGDAFDIVPENSYIQERCAEDIASFGLGRNDLADFLSETANSVSSDAVEKFSNLKADNLQTLLESKAADIMEMRMLLARNFSPEKTILRISDELAIAFAWTAAHGILQLIVGRNERTLRENILRRRTSRHVQLAVNGSLLDTFRPWLAVNDLPDLGPIRNLVINAYLVDLIHERLLSFYLQINLENLRSRLDEDSGDEAMRDEVLALSCHDLAIASASSQAAASSITLPTRRIRPMRQELFLCLLEKLGCEIRHGKGSEITVYRPGGKKYRLGRNKEIPSVLVKSVLARIGISVPEWLAVAQTR